MVKFPDQKLLALLRPLPLVDVLNDPNAIEKFPLIVEHGGCRHSDPRGGAVLSDVSLLKFVVLHFTPHMPGVKLPLVSGLVWVRQVEQRPAQQLVSRVAREG